MQLAELPLPALTSEVLGRATRSPILHQDSHNATFKHIPQNPKWPNGRFGNCSLGVASGQSHSRALWEGMESACSREALIMRMDGTVDDMNPA